MESTAAVNCLCSLKPGLGIHSFVLSRNWKLACQGRVGVMSSLDLPTHVARMLDSGLALVKACK